MASARDRYLSEIASQWQYLPTWLPGRAVRLGQTGVFEDGSVQVDDDISASGFSFTEDVDQSTSSLSYCSQRAVSWGWAGGAGSPTGERADVEVSFSRANAILFHAHEAVEHRIANLSELKSRILELDRKAAWAKNKAVVVSVVTARSTTVLISSSAGASVTCEAKAGAALGSLADPELGLKQRSARNMDTTLVAEGALTPLYQALVLRKGMLGGSQVKRALRGADALAADDPLRAAVDSEFALCAIPAD
jgi:hypothetical protein